MVAYTSEPARVCNYNTLELNHAAFSTLYMKVRKRCGGLSPFGLRLGTCLH